MKCFVDVILPSRREEEKVVPCAIGLTCNGGIRARPVRTRKSFRPVTRLFHRLREGGRERSYSHRSDLDIKRNGSRRGRGIKLRFENENFVSG